MRLLIFLLAFNFLIVSCLQKTQLPEIKQSSCNTVPEDIVKKVGKEHKLDWNCRLQRAYEDGRLKIIYSDDGDYVCMTYETDETEYYPEDSEIELFEK